MSFSDVIRREFKSSDEKRDAWCTVPNDVVSYRDICYTDRESQTYNDRWHLLDVYRPDMAEKTKLPVIVSVHGGGWVYGDKDVYRFYCMDLCRRGFAVVNFSYRLAPEDKFPAQLYDTVSAFKWVSDNAEKYGFDIDRIYAVGDSAGANLLALYCTLCVDADYRNEFNAFSKKVSDKDGGIFDIEHLVNKLPMPRAVALNCGAYDIRANYREMKGFMSELMPEKGTDKELDIIDVIKNINDKFPSVFLVTCYGDFLIKQAPLLEDKLKDMGIPYVSKLYGSEKHPLKHVFNCDISLEEARICNDETCEFFDRY